MTVHKRPLVGHGFFLRFAIAIGPSVLASVIIVFLLDLIHPRLGDASGRWALLIAVAAAWHYARMWKNEEEADAYVATLPKVIAPPAKYYFRATPDGEIQGPEIIEAVKSVSLDHPETQVVEAVGQSYGTLKRAKWVPLDSVTKPQT